MWWTVLIAVLIIAVLAGLFIFLYLKNKQVEEPDGCDILKDDACRGCPIGDSCVSKK